ncbi:MAG: tRNA 2-thiouridine(34) synthase MnmA [Pseudoflavonifractor sp.]
MREKIVLGLSGGVDSAVAAGLLMEQYEVHCVFLDIGLGGTAGADAVAVAEKLGLSFESVDIRKALEEHVCGPFAADYLAGRTPLPCAKCNPSVKFPALLAVADRMGAPWVATGHYARSRTENGRTLLLKGMPANDQSYMLARLPQSMLSRIVFPLGDYEKNQVRALAGAEALPVAEKPDSMEICFIPDGDYAAWLDARGGTPSEGDFVDETGQVLGRHRGYHHYTLGQGRGLGVSGPHRYFVSAIDPAQNRVVLSDGSDLYADRANCSDPNWIAISDLQGTLEVQVRLRHSKTETAALLSPTAEGVLLQMKTPARAPTPGQLAVFYQGDTVIGSGWIN